MKFALILAALPALCSGAGIRAETASAFKAQVMNRMNSMTDAEALSLAELATGKGDDGPGGSGGGAWVAGQPCNSCKNKCTGIMPSCKTFMPPIVIDTTEAGGGVHTTPGSCMCMP